MVPKHYPQLTLYKIMVLWKLLCKLTFQSYSEFRWILSILRGIRKDSKTEAIFIVALFLVLARRPYKCISQFSSTDENYLLQ